MTIIINYEAFTKALKTLASPKDPATVKKINQHAQQVSLRYRIAQEKGQREREAELEHRRYR